ncbi:MAG: fluoride efflux transporter CrcB [Alphaproteobacteria bacterium]|nr:fluoride efflux transporter CrcB [Alphaproteobacteria bacterium]
MPPILLVFLGGGAGAVSRWWFSAAVTRWLGLTFPYGTLGVNILGSFAMGLLVGWLARHSPPNAQDLRTLLAVGFLGGFTTFSAFSLDSVSLIERGQWGAAALYIALSIILCVGGLFAGLLLTRGFAG